MFNVFCDILYVYPVASNFTEADTEGLIMVITLACGAVARLPNGHKFCILFVTCCFYWRFQMAQCVFIGFLTKFFKVVCIFLMCRITTMMLYCYLFVDLS